MKRGEFPREVKAAIWAREAGMCISCGRSVEAVGQWSYQHRRPRGLGGSRAADTGSVQNGLLACGSATTYCHNLMESNRTLAGHLGYLVPQGCDPLLFPVFSARNGWVLLTKYGDYLAVDQDDRDGITETFGRLIADVKTGDLL